MGIYSTRASRMASVGRASARSPERVVAREDLLDGDPPLVLIPHDVKAPAPAAPVPPLALRVEIDKDFFLHAKVASMTDAKVCLCAEYHSGRTWERDGRGRERCRRAHERGRGRARGRAPDQREQAELSTRARRPGGRAAQGRRKHGVKRIFGLHPCTGRLRSFRVSRLRPPDRRRDAGARGSPLARCARSHELHLGTG